MSTTRQPHLSEVCLQVDDLLDAYALDALEPEERIFVQEHLDGCLQQRDRLAELEEVLSMVGQAVTPLPPPPALWERLLTETGPVARAAVAAPEVVPARPAPEVVPARPTPIRAAIPASRPSKVVTMNRWVAWAGGVAAALLLASTVALGAALQRADGNDGDGETAADPLVAMVARGGQVVPLDTQPQPAELSEVGQGSLLVAPGMTPAVVVDHWTPSSDALKYIVWMAAASGGEATVLGEIKVDEDGNGILVLNGVTSFEGFDVFGISIQTTEGAALQDVLLGDPDEQTG